MPDDASTVAAADPGQLLLCGIPGPELDPATAAILRAVRPGGYILFTRNIRTPEQLRRLTDDLRDLGPVEPIITIDQEGGRVSRLKQLGNEPPAAAQLRDRGDPGLIRRHGELTARLLRLFGFNLDLCPVLDLAFADDADNSLRGRCYGRSVAEVVRNADLFATALRGGGVLTCGKHFPGYSRAACDAHHLLPEVAIGRADWEANELAAFRPFLPRLDSMMIGHALYPALQPPAELAGDRPLPTSLSPAVVGRLLRAELGFAGLIMTDDLDMGAISNHFPIADTIRLAIAAGNDLAMICHRLAILPAARRALEDLGPAALEPALARVAACKRQLAPPTPFGTATFHELDAAVWQLRVATLGPAAAASRSPEDGKRSPVEIY